MPFSRYPGYIQTLDHLKKGDVLMFRAPKKAGFFGHAILFMQSLLSQKHGHYDTTHTAICTGRNRDGKPMIAHVTGHKIMRYQHEPLEEMINRDGSGNRPFVVYRPEKKAAQKIADVATDNQNKNLKYDPITAAGSLFRIPSLNPKRKLPAAKKLSTQSFCSRFVVQAIKTAASPKSKDALLEKDDELTAYYPHLRSITTPKALEAYLYNDTDRYAMFVYPGKDNPYEVIKREINDQMMRVAKRTDLASKNKAAMLRDMLRKTTKTVEREMSDRNSLEKSMYLVKKMTPYLKMNTGFNMTESASYKSVISKAREMAVFERDIQQYARHKKKNR